MADSTPAPTATASIPPDFGTDPRLHLSKETNTWRYEADDGTEMEWDTTKSAWVPVLEEDTLKSQQAAYSVAGVDEAVPAKPVLDREKKGKKRKQPEDFTSATDGNGLILIKRGKGTEKPKENHKPSASKNTAVYVTNIPRDATVDEIAERFNKCGVLMEDDEGDPRIKFYADDQGNFNGEALVVYFKEDSVILAENLLDDAELRIGDSSSRMRVQKAEFGHKGGTGGENGEAQRRVVDKKKATKRIVKMQKKLEGWDSDDEFGPSKEKGESYAPRPSRIVILKHMFTLDELKEDPTLLIDLKEDVREECENLGVVTNVILYDQEEEGIMTVRFKDVISAQACVLKMNGRFFAGRKIAASYLNGKATFRKSGREEVDGEHDEGDEKQRLDEFAKWLEGGDKPFMSGPSKR